MDFDRSLTRSDIIREMGFSKWEADKFLARFGHSTGVHRPRVIGQRELMFLQLDGVIAEWVKQNCPEGRRTVAERKKGV